MYCYLHPIMKSYYTVTYTTAIFLISEREDGWLSIPKGWWASAAIQGVVQTQRQRRRPPARLGLDLPRATPDGGCREVVYRSKLVPNLSGGAMGMVQVPECRR